MASATIYHGTRARAIRYTGGHTQAPPRRQPFMATIAKAVRQATKALFTGTQTTAGTYILPHTGSYVFGRWYRSHMPGFGEHTRWVQLGERPTVEACREAMEAHEKAQEQRAKLLNRKRMRRA